MLDNLGGVYCEDADIAVLADEKSGSSNTGGVRLYSLDETNAKRLWKLSEEMTGVTFRVN
jgi:hypothetical protein